MTPLPHALLLGLLVLGVSSLPVSDAAARTVTSSDSGMVLEEAPQPTQKAEENPAVCVTHHIEARYGAIGYDHLVHIQNGCSKTAYCAVTTNVNRTPVRDTIPSKERRTLVTYKGSPASSFSAKVTCSLKGMPGG